MNISDEAVEGHKRRPLDDGEYVCQCGWVPDWHGAPLAEQVAAHLEEMRKK
jgi:hypothetical protein